MHSVSNEHDLLVEERPKIKSGSAGKSFEIPFAIVRAIAVTISIFVLLLASYLTFWALSYRQPTGSPLIIDRRASLSDKPYYISSCAALADNPVGFPGHCYVVWTSDLHEDFNSAQSAGYVPSHRFDQLPSLWTHVPGMVAKNCVRGNLRNLYVLTVIVDRADYEKTQLTCDSWKTDQFQAGVRDCVAFANAIASELDLATPATAYKYPQDYLRELKNLNDADMKNRSQSDFSKYSHLQRRIAFDVLKAK